MKIIKVFNNNVSLILNEDGQEEVVMGRGIGFGLSPGDQVDQSLIEKRFILNDEKSVPDIEQLVKRIDYQDINLASDIFDLFEKRFQKTSTPTSVLALADHISFAIQRTKEKMLLRTPLEWELKQIYPQEYQVALQAVKLLTQKTGIKIPEEEAGFITLHYVSSFEDSEGMEETMLSSQIIQNILSIVNYHYGKEFKQDSIYFSRFITHIRYFVKRQLAHKKSTNDTSSLLSVVRLKYPNDYNCALKIKSFLEKNYGWQISESELFYLTLHLNRLAS